MDGRDVLFEVFKQIGFAEMEMDHKEFFIKKTGMKDMPEGTVEFRNWPDGAYLTVWRDDIQVMWIDWFRMNGEIRIDFPNRLSTKDLFFNFWIEICQKVKNLLETE